MKRFRSILPIGVAVLAFMLTFMNDGSRIGTRHLEKKYYPGDWFYRQRAYPLNTIDPELRRLSLEQAEQLKAAMSPLANASWRQKGPSNVGGRITTMAISQQNPNIIYVGAADGGVLKSTNAGTNWTPLFDDKPSISMGAVAVDPSNDNIVYAGTGEANSSGDSYDGVGVFKSTNGGATWTHLGLTQTRHIGKIVIDPSNTSTLYLAAMGTLFTGNPDRGVYKSTDGGTSWTRVLFINDSTGVVDISINPQNPSILIAGAWQRMRAPEGRRYVGGVHTGIYRTTNGGANWALLQTGLPAPAATVGRPAVAIAPSNPSIMYAAYADDPGFFLGSYKSTDGGNSWTRMSDATLSNLYSSFGWYFGKVFVHPTDANRVFICGVQLGRSTNGGQSWAVGSTSHADNHAMVFDPTNPLVIYNGNDGGFCGSADGGVSWIREPDQDLEITQFYAGTIDFLNPSRSMGGTQDNGTPRTLTGGRSDWGSINGGDGFYCAIDYTNNNYQYAESQFGGRVRTINNWSSASGASNGITSSDRDNWSTPYILDPNNPMVLYTGTHRVYKSLNRAVSWFVISPDLSDGPVPGFTSYATVTTIDAAKTDTAVIMAGTDDANVWVTTNAGVNWTNISAGLPNRWITRVRFDPTNHQIAYVTCSGYRIDEALPHVYRTSNLGASWQNISGNLPEAPVNVILVDPQYPQRLYIGTDVGTYFTTNTGATWQAMGVGLPNVAVSDMALHAPTRIARAFTHGRSMWEISLDSLVLTGVQPVENIPFSMQLHQNYPNPFNPSTTIAFNLSAGGRATLTIFDAIGRRVSTLVDEELPAGRHSMTWSGRDVASGMYLYELRVSNGPQSAVTSRKMLLMR